MSGSKTFGIITDELSLHDAAAIGDERKIEDFKLFVKRGKFDINFQDEDWGERTALHCASERGIETFDDVFLLVKEQRFVIGRFFACFDWSAVQ
eukprot:gene4736-5359_t